MLTTAVVEKILSSLPTLSIGIVGDLFLDRYLEIDPALNEPSIETGLDAYQVVRVRPSPGAAGTVLNNLVALGVGRVRVVSLIGDDGEGYELRQVLGTKKGVDTEQLLSTGERRTPTYTKPILVRSGRDPQELNRLDIKNRARLSAIWEDRLIAGIKHIWPRLSGLLVLDQVSEEDCGVVTGRVRQFLAELGEKHPDKLILADSRERIGAFNRVWLKPNREECAKSVGKELKSPAEVEDAVRALASRTGRPVFCTCGASGMLVLDPREGEREVKPVSAYPVSGPIDIVGAGDSSSAAIACALASGTSLEEAAAFGNLVASITIQQIGTTGTASPEQVRQRLSEM